MSSQAPHPVPCGAAGSSCAKSPRSSAGSWPVEVGAFFVVAVKPVFAFAVAVDLGGRLLETNSDTIPHLWPATVSAVCCVCALWIRWSSAGGSDTRAGWCRLVSWLWILVASVFARVALRVAYGTDPAPTWPLLVLVLPFAALALYRVGKDSRLWELRALSASVLVAEVALPAGMWSMMEVLPGVLAAYASVSASAVLSVAVCRR